MRNLSLLVLLGFIWGTGYSIARFAMTHGVPPIGYSFWQSLGPAIIISLITLFSGIGSKTSPLTTKRSRFYLISGLTGIVIPNTCMYFAATHLPASILAIVVNTVPIIAYPMALFMRLEKFNVLRFFGILLALAGLMFIIIPKSSLPSPNLIPWVIGTLITPFSFAVCSIYIARYRPANTNSLALSAGMLIFSSLMLIPMVVLTNSFYSFQIPLTTPDWIILIEIVLSSIGYILFFQLIKLAGPVYYSLVDTVVVLTGVLWGYFLFNEHLNVWTATAVCCIVIALLIVTHEQRKAVENT